MTLASDLLAAVQDVVGEFSTTGVLASVTDPGTYQDGAWVGRVTATETVPMVPVYQDQTTTKDRLTFFQLAQASATRRTAKTILPGSIANTPQAGDSLTTGGQVWTVVNVRRIPTGAGFVLDLEFAGAA